jgi:hypothetical protein
MSSDLGKLELSSYLNLCWAGVEDDGPKGGAAHASKFAHAQKAFIWKQPECQLIWAIEEQLCNSKIQ